MARLCTALTTSNYGLGSGSSELCAELSEQVEQMQAYLDTRHLSGWISHGKLVDILTLQFMSM